MPTQAPTPQSSPTPTPEPDATLKHNLGYIPDKNLDGHVSKHDGGGRAEAGLHGQRDEEGRRRTKRTLTIGSGPPKGPAFAQDEEGLNNTNGDMIAPEVSYDPEV